MKIPVDSTFIQDVGDMGHNFLFYLIFRLGYDPWFLQALYSYSLLVLDLFHAI